MTSTSYTIDKSAPVVVTGASGFVAGELIKLLIDTGYTQVRGTVRSLKDEAKVKHLRDLFPSLQLYEADLLQDGSFDTVCAGAEAVFHTASPFQLVVPNPQKDLIEPAVNGTLTVLKSAAKAGTVKRVVLTSSCAAVMRDKVPEGYRMTEADWNDESTIETNPYMLSKTLAEQAAWDFIKKHQEAGNSMQLVTILPSFVIGPPLSDRTDAYSIYTLKDALSGAWKKDGAPPVAFGVNDVRDLAQAHVLAMEKPDASGRYMITSQDAVSHFQLTQYLKESGEFDNYPLPDKLAAPVEMKFSADNSRAMSLGVTLRDPRESIVDMAKALIAFGIVEKK